MFYSEEPDNFGRTGSPRSKLSFFLLAHKTWDSLSLSIIIRFVPTNTKACIYVKARKVVILVTIGQCEV